jgi:protein phosphatase
MSNDPLPDTGEYFVPIPVSPLGLPWPADLTCQADVAAQSHPGKVRPNNEDAYLVARVGRFLEPLLTNLPADQLRDHENMGYALAVADGIGGMAAGEVASRLALTTVVKLVLHTSDWVVRTGTWENQRLLQRMAERYRLADVALRAGAAADPDLAGMGSTMTVAFNLGTDLFVGHVGDSRAYLYHDGRLHQLTRDHTYAQDMVDKGIIQPDNVAKHRFRHVLTRALGGRDNGREDDALVEADVQRVRLGDGDQVLLCTDGLTDLVEDAAIAAVLCGAGTAQEACQRLIDLALGQGGKDNVTVALGRYQFP